MIGLGLLIGGSILWFLGALVVFYWAPPFSNPLGRTTLQLLLPIPFLTGAVCYSFGAGEAELFYFFCSVLSAEFLLAAFVFTVGHLHLRCRSEIPSDDTSSMIETPMRGGYKD